MTNQLSRRDFLKLSTALGGFALTPSWMSRLSFAPQGVEPSGDLLVVVFLRGAIDGLNAVIPHAESRYYDLRPELAIPEPKSGDDKSAIDLDGFFSLHPSLRPLKNWWDDKSLAIVHAVGSPDPSHSHFDAQDYMESGSPGQKLDSGWIGRHLQTASWQNESPFRAVGMGGVRQSSLRGTVPVTTLNSIAEFNLHGATQAQLAQLYALGSNYDSLANETFAAINTLSQVDTANFTPEGGAEYPETDVSMALQQVAQIAKAEIGMEVACIDVGGWDTHNQQGVVDGTFGTLLTDLATAMDAFYRDLGDRAKRVTLLTMSEFGRRAYENGSGGTDHGHGSLMFLLGGNVNGGKVYGDWPTLAEDKLYGPGDLAVTTDFRDILSEVLIKRLNNPHQEDVFPDYAGWQDLGILREG
ncbi:MAG: DUF1501 domain-containing protein [Anaerolineae bacterium]|nr:DUF1501 domain-containing protein [Anaerolineae bacterium]MBT4311855.1 DUF1501 domain-containing protein [Anaerolineae bacterium]MBT4458077.1 DUF1501 domain-containing protein [Anaerolineae bacterium]MBT4842519.1 DUF1501 domain-containing protein [Anaerolineae bacterium]MBT6059967.1 DUF1501 domain-containing protein [Anaerolineae bacterium]